jgi:hypothetical protein
MSTSPTYIQAQVTGLDLVRVYIYMYCPTATRRENVLLIALWYTLWPWKRPLGNFLCPRSILVRTGSRQLLPMTLWSTAWLWNGPCNICFPLARTGHHIRIIPRGSPPCFSGAHRGLHVTPLSTFPVGSDGTLRASACVWCSTWSWH